MVFSVTVVDWPVYPNDFSVLLPRHYLVPDPHPDPSVKVIDIIETWKGVSMAQAAEIRFWDEAFKAALTKLIAHDMSESFKKAGICIEDDDQLTLREMQLHVSSLGYQSVYCNIDKLIDHMLALHSLSEEPHPWLKEDRRTAVANFLRLSHVFCSEQPFTYGFFYGEVSSSGSLNIYARLHRLPHLFQVEKAAEGDNAVFGSPKLDERFGMYPVDISGITKALGSAYQLTVATLFPGNVRFERLYRFHHEPPSKPKGKAKKARKRSAAPRSTSPVQLREVSQQSVRVQGTRELSEFERSAREAHRPMYNTYQDARIGKATLMGKIYGMEDPKPDERGGPSVRMMHFDDIKSGMGSVRTPKTKIKIRVPRKSKTPQEYISFPRVRGSSPIPLSNNSSSDSEDDHPTTRSDTGSGSDFSFSPARLSKSPFMHSTISRASKAPYFHSPTRELIERSSKRSSSEDKRSTDDYLTPSARFESLLAASPRSARTVELSLSSSGGSVRTAHRVTGSSGSGVGSAHERLRSLFSLDQD